MDNNHTKIDTEIADLLQLQKYVTKIKLDADRLLEKNKVQFDLSNEIMELFNSIKECNEFVMELVDKYEN